MDEEEEIDFGEDHKVLSGDFNQTLHNELFDQAQQLHQALDHNDFQETFQELFKFIQPVGFKLIQDIPDKSRLDIPIDIAIGFKIYKKTQKVYC